MPKLIKKYPFEIILTLIVLISHCYVIFCPPNSLMSWFGTDDVFYYFKTAQNISEGYGSTFDRIGLTNGYHPLWMLICIPIFSLAKADPILPLRIVIAVLAVFHALSACLFYRLFKKIASNTTAIAVALFWAFFPGVHNITVQFAMESGVQAFFVILFLNLVVDWESNQNHSNKEKIIGLIGISIAAIFVLFSRLDSMFMLFIFGIWLSLKSNNVRRSLFLGDMLVIVLAVFLAYYLRLGLTNSYYLLVASGTWMAIIAIALRMALNYFADLYGNKSTLNNGEMLKTIVIYQTAGSIILTGIMFLLSYIKVFNGFPRSALAIELALTIGFQWIIRIIANHLEQKVTILEKTNWPRLIKNGLAYFLPLGTALLTYMTWSHYVFGTSSPVSGQIKRWWGTIYSVYGRPIDALVQVAGLGRHGAWIFLTNGLHSLANAASKFLKIKDKDPNNTWFILIALMLISILIYFLSRNHKDYFKNAVKTTNIFPLFVGCYFQIASYNMTGYVNSHAWYWICEIVLVVILGGITFELLYRNFKESLQPKQLYAIFAVCLVALGVYYTYHITSTIRWKVHKEDVEGYLAGAKGLEATTEPGAVIGSTGGGVLGYFVKDRTIVNLDGLINSYQYFQMLKNGRANEYLDKIGMDYVYANKYILTSSEPYERMFRNRLEYMDMVVGSALFHYKTGVQNPD